ncbi:MAG TPA: hypothetical protein DEF85_02040 [Clostridiaceae bacterium]|nr:hypothetical protein [Clostridiaceae bacterium]
MDKNYIQNCIESYKMEHEQYKYEGMCKSMFDNREGDIRIFKVFNNGNWISTDIKRLKVNDLVQIYDYTNWSNERKLHEDENGNVYFIIVKAPYKKSYKIRGDIVSNWRVDLEGISIEEAEKYMNEYKHNSEYKYTGFKLTKK